MVSTDLFYDPRPDVELAWRADGAVAVEMETASLFALARRRELDAASLLVVSDLVLPARERIDDGALVTELRPDGPASKSDLRAGDIILAVDGKKVATAAQLRFDRVADLIELA